MNIVKIKPVTSYEITIGTTNFGRFDLAGHWEGMTKMVSKEHGTLIIADGIGVGLARVFDTDTDAAFVGGSPNLAFAARLAIDAQAKKTEQP